MKSIWKWLLSRDMASTRLLAIAALVLNYLGFSAAKNPDPSSWELWVGVVLYVGSVAALVALVVAATSQSRPR